MKLRVLSSQCRVTSVRENQGGTGNFKVPFQIRESQGKSTSLEKIGEKNGNFIMNQGEKIREFRCSIYLLFFLDFSRKFRSRLRRWHTSITSLTFRFAPLALEYWLIIVIVFKWSSWISEKNQGSQGKNEGFWNCLETCHPAMWELFISRLMCSCLFCYSFSII